MIDAYHCYHTWGAKAKVAHLKNSYPQLLGSIINPPTNNINFNESNNSVILFWVYAISPAWMKLI